MPGTGFFLVIVNKCKMSKCFKKHKIILRTNELPPKKASGEHGFLKEIHHPKIKRVFAPEWYTFAR